MTDETLVLRADPIVRERLRTIFWIRLSSAFAMLAPAVGMTFFLYLQGRGEIEPVLPGGEPPPDTLPSMYAVLWSVWLPLGILCVITGGIIAVLAWKAFAGYRREFRLTGLGLEEKDPLSIKRLLWKDVQALEIGQDYTVRGRGQSFRLSAEWLGREAADQAGTFLKAHIPREKTVTVSGTLEEWVERLARLAPTILAGLVAAIAALATYWVFLRPQ